MAKVFDQRHFAGRDEWRTWLAENYVAAKEEQHLV
jgi:hypothetical protein